MSYAIATPIRRPREEPHLAPAPRRVRIVSTRAQRRARPRIVYALGATLVIFGIFLAQLLITISLSSGAYRIDDLQATAQTLGRTASALNERLETLGSSQNLEANARALGMVGSSNAAFLRLSDGAVLGFATPAHSGRHSSDSKDGVANALLTDIPLITPPVPQGDSTGSGHGDSNTQGSGPDNPESTQGQLSPTGSTNPASSNSPDSGGLPSPVTH